MFEAHENVSGALRIAVRDKALDTNPVREAEPLEAGRKKSPRALTLEERVRWLDMLESHPKAVKRDLPDLSRFMMATGVRIGEALAVYWEDVDFEAGTVAVNYTVIRVKDIGLIRKSTKTEAGERTLLLPRWALDMLQRRRKTTSFPNGAGLPGCPWWAPRPVQHPEGPPESEGRRRVRLGDLARLQEDGGDHPR
ncbi:Phage integrase family protein [Actinosynnema pretiosum]|nr:Phage integrase family protein [Actinosynnema pretiosum]